MAWGWLSTLNDSDEDLASLSVRPQVPQETSSHLPYSPGFLGGGMAGLPWVPGVTIPLAEGIKLHMCPLR